MNITCEDCYAIWILRFSKKAIWSAFALVGKDALVSIPSIQHAMLDQLIDKVEKEIANKVNKNPLNPNSFLPKGERKRHMSKRHMSKLKLHTCYII